MNRLPQPCTRNLKTFDLAWPGSRLVGVVTLLALAALAGACGNGTPADDGGVPDAAGDGPSVPDGSAGDLPVPGDQPGGDTVPADGGGQDVATPDADAGPDMPASAWTGIYFNAFSGGFSGSEWFEVVALEEPGRYTLTDIFGGGFTGTIDDAGAITLESGAGVGAGEFSGPDAFVIRPTIQGVEFTFDCTRVPFTTPAFNLRARPAVTPDPALAGTFQNQLSFHDVVTGTQKSGGTEVLDVTIVNGNLRIADAQGLYFQGPFVEPNLAVFRVVDGAGAEFATFPGSETNVGQDLLGEVVYDGTDAFTGTFLLQSRAPLGQQEQVLIRFVATRQ